MATKKNKSKIGKYFDGEWGNGDSVTIQLSFSKTYAGNDVSIPVRIWKAPQKGPIVFITAAVHGDEINGTGTIRELIASPPFELTKGALIMAPVVNIPGFEQHTRYLPDRRDLNRSFPGSKSGSTAGRLARVVYEEIILNSDWGIDLHTAALRRTNFPNIRADMRTPAVAELAHAFGAELIVDGAGPTGCLRATASRAGVPTIVLEAGEVWKVERSVLEYTLHGVRNCLIHLGMVEGDPVEPNFRSVAKNSTWVRSKHGGFLQFHVAPGDILSKGDPIATNTSLTANEQNILLAPRDGIVLGMTTMPAVEPGSPVCHIANQTPVQMRKAETAQNETPDTTLYDRMREDLATNIALDS